jgi:GT2 family glycosyltransferase
MSTPTSPPASIVIPTRARYGYLEVALASVVPQARAAGAEVLVIDDAGPSERARAQAQRLGARYEPHPRPLGLNVARNSGVERSLGELVVFVDDDIEAAPGWLAALLGAAREHPDVDVFTGPIRARLEGPSPRSCGRESAPITTLELGPRDVETRYGWGSNMAIRRGALERVGLFEVSLRDGGDEQEWQERMRAQRPGARVLYVAGAAVDHRRAGSDARLRALARGAYVRGMAARRFDSWRGEGPSLARELDTLAGCALHVVRHACPAAITMVAHSAGRTREALRRETREAPEAMRREALRRETREAPETLRGSPQAPGEGSSAAAEGPDGAPEDFLSGESGTVGGAGALLREAGDLGLDAWEIASLRRARLARAARREPPARSVLALQVARPERRAQVARTRAELMRSRHQVQLQTRAPGGEGKFQNLNRLLAEHPADASDWVLVLDDDIELPRGFLDRFLFLCERFSLALAQPAHRLNSHAAWPLTRRRAGSVARETGFVEIGPVTAFARVTFGQLLPFPPLRMGWGLDAHWAAVAREHGWRCGVIDAVAISHRAAPAADSYSRTEAVSEARRFLADHPYLRAGESQRTLTAHRRF